MRSIRVFLSLIGVLLTGTLHARETAVLRSGFTISHDHHQLLGATTRLFLTTSDDEYVDVATTSISSFEKEEDAPVATIAPKVSSAEDLDQIVDRVSRENQLDSDFVYAVIRAESAGNTHAVSRKGAQGLMQLMPRTALTLGVKDPFDPRENVGAGTKYLRELLTRYKDDPVRALAAYNAGTSRVQQYEGIPPFYETRAYVSNVIREFNRRKLQRKTAQNASKTRTSPEKPKTTTDGE